MSVVVMIVQLFPWRFFYNATIFLSVLLKGDAQVARHVARIAAAKLKDKTFVGESVLSATEVDHWIRFSCGKLQGNNQDHTGAVKELNSALALRTFLVDKCLTLADVVVWSILQGESSRSYF